MERLSRIKTDPKLDEKKMVLQKISKNLHYEYYFLRPQRNRIHNKSKTYILKPIYLER